jgi:hypothetical protein
MPAPLDITGRRFNRLTALRRVGTAKTGGALWLFACSCGQKKELPLNCVTSGNTQSCGCLAREHSAAQGRRNVTHGQGAQGRVSPEYRAYTSAKSRCENPDNADFYKYGGQGVEFRFSSFEEWYSELGPRPTPKHSVDRKDSGGHYEPGMIRWADLCQQAWNRRKAKMPSSSRFKGPSWHAPSNRWRVYITCRGKKIYVGSFRNEEDAAVAYDEAARKYFQQFAHCNFQDIAA